MKKTFILALKFCPFSAYEFLNIIKIFNLKKKLFLILLFSKSIKLDYIFPIYNFAAAFGLVDAFIISIIL